MDVDLDARAAGLMATLVQNPDFEQMAARLKGLIGTPRREELMATIAQAESLLSGKGFDPHQRRDWLGRWSDLGTLGPAPGGFAHPGGTNNTLEVGATGLESGTRPSGIRVEKLGHGKYRLHPPASTGVEPVTANSEKEARDMIATLERTLAGAGRGTSRPTAPSPYILGGP